MTNRVRGEQAHSRHASGGLMEPSRNLARGVRWFAAEFLVVVCGVLVALALNAYYQSRIDAERESRYIEQLAADLGESEAQLDDALATNRDERAKLTTLLALFGENEVPAVEEFNELKVLSFAMAEPTLSTAQAVVESGDLHLIQDDAIRNAIIQFVGDGEAFLEGQGAMAWEWLAPGIRDYYAIVRPGLGPGHELATSPAEALSQEALYDIGFDLRLGYSNLIRLQKQMLEAVRRIQGKIARVGEEKAPTSG